MKILLDTNVVLDVLLDREPFVHQAAKLFEMIEAGHLEGVVGATTITTIDYFLKKYLSAKEAVSTLKKLLKLFGIRRCTG
jgi:predicted nucleic acid-binding protein